MNLVSITKRSGEVVPYNKQKIFNAIKGANSCSVEQMSDRDIESVTNSVEDIISKENNIGVEKIQDVVEDQLMKYGFYEVAKKYIVYRQHHMMKRSAKKDLMKTFNNILFSDSISSDDKRENANINTDGSMGIMLKIGCEASKQFVDNVLPEKFVKMDNEDWAHIHDKDFSMICFNCCQIDLLKVFHGGFGTGHGFLREPNSIRSYGALACIVIQSDQNDCFGGQSINAFDYAMAEGVRKSFIKAIIKQSVIASIYLVGTRMLDYRNMKNFVQFMKEKFDFDNILYDEERKGSRILYSERYKTTSETLNNVFWTYSDITDDKFHELRNAIPQIYMLACKDVEEETHQSMEAVIHNFNTLHSRCGAQVPFSSINFGTDTSPEGRLVIKEILNSIYEGLGNGETSIFPISVFKLRKGVNFEEGEPNYDLFLQACKVSAKRLFPNFLNVSSSFNAPYLGELGDYNKEVATMGCADGDEIVAYELDGEFYCEGIKRLWERIYHHGSKIRKLGTSSYMIPQNLKIWDGENGFVRVKTVVQNPDFGNWERVTFTDGRSILVTSDHPLYTENRGRVHVSELKIGDSIKTYYNLPIPTKMNVISSTTTPELINVKEIEHLGKLGKPSFDVETVTDKFTLSFINSGNCRTRVMSNVNGPEESGGRGNFSFTTINLPKLALEARKISKENNTDVIEEFYKLYDKYIDMSHDYICYRLQIIADKHVYNFPFLMGQGVWMDSEKLNPNDTIRDVLKHASYSLGFCGLAECLVALIGKHHGESEEAQKLGLEIVGHLRKRCDEFTEAEHMNWTCFSTPAESTAGKFLRACRRDYGIIKGITDREYFTNSFHCPVYYKISALNKIKLEAPYHALCNAGAISYIEMDGDPSKNVDAFVSIIKAMRDSDMGYYSINHPVDRDPVCGFTGIIENECPHCHRREDGNYKVRIKKL